MSSDDMIVYVDNSKESIDKLLESVNEFNEIVRNKLDVQELIFSIH